jgi:hypothetical protein
MIEEINIICGRFHKKSNFADEFDDDCLRKVQNDL